METRPDIRFMRLALRLAARAIGDTAPNPVVGAVVVNRGRVVGKGHHARVGLPHAEVVALRRAGSKARGATLYASLEPCNHTGRTGPCCDAILEAGIRRVVAAMVDPNPITRGRGLARLRRAGVAVTTGVLADEAARLNRPFVKVMTRRLPWVTAKIAQSLDGKIATRAGVSRWISSEASRRLAHRLRREADAVVVGINTVLRDDPLLTARDPFRRARPERPIKVILDSRLRLSRSSRCLSSASPAPTVVATTSRSPAKEAALRRRGAEVAVLRPVRGQVPLRRVLELLVRRYGVLSVLIEGGGEVLASALRARLVDRVVWCVAPIIIGGRTSPTAVGGEGIAALAEAVRLEGVTLRRVGQDLVIDAAVIYPEKAKSYFKTSAAQGSGLRARGQAKRLRRGSPGWPRALSPQPRAKEGFETDSKPRAAASRRLSSLTPLTAHLSPHTSHLPPH
ncbi:MAG: bifunctional diaminohydroxyphosphoribosylaminopyrimidine deaminase/5-amino-6-(5-phosphoribosylamino)uracil reductase RibD [Candidatus Omnitrophica bacterium]|nr:bifunctional diaminohydroxyphosphoribosylaminopyrimidine deaminase/5-amino-6-(5-phosphoribosylamino)uracil reductase RibD [Candidatus Omnitrophota bacterium]